jgi:hypothetical protein
MNRDDEIEQNSERKTAGSAADNDRDKQGRGFAFQRSPSGLGIM